MYKIFLIFIFALSLKAEMVNGVAVVVKQEPITLSDIKEEMRKSNSTEEEATDNLIRKKLEGMEIQERKISVSSTDVYNEIKQVAASNKMSVEALYDMVRETNGLSSTDFKEKTKEKLLSQRLYTDISYSSMTQPSEEEIKEYYDLHKDEFSRPLSFDVIIYSSPDKNSLEKVVSNPMLNISDVTKSEQKLFYEKLPKELSRLLENTEPNKFTPIISNEKNAYTIFYLKAIEHQKDATYENKKNKIINLIMAQKREQVLSDYFAKLRNNSDIKILRQLNQNAK
ncbi:MAG: hypothetical protein QG559_1313 [Campylobacterota bacterium]|nr:hypothetical protein [Campylobacterota bacterium]